MIGPEFPDEVPARVPERTLREFAALCIVVFGGVFALSWFWRQRTPSAWGWFLLAIALLIGLPGLIWPNRIRPVYQGALALAKLNGHFVGLTLLALVYFGVLTPLAFLFRLARRDGLGRFIRPCESYWVDHEPTTDVRRYLRQYQRQTTRSVMPSSSPAATATAGPAAPTLRVEFSNPPSTAFSGANHGSA
jgi:hypothetical protein